MREKTGGITDAFVSTDPFVPLVRRSTPKSQRGLGETLYSAVDRRVEEWRESPSGIAFQERAQREAEARRAAEAASPVTVVDETAAAAEVVGQTATIGSMTVSAMRGSSDTFGEDYEW